MAWQPKDLMDIKREFVELALQDGCNRRELCRRFGISPKSAYALLQRFAQEGAGAYTPRSRRPHSSPARTPSAMEQTVTELRALHPGWGGRKIARRLQELGHGDVPPPSTGSALSTRRPTRCGRSTSRATLPPWCRGAATR
jgi:Homeodomain-like domain